MRSLTQNSGHSANRVGDFTGLNEVVRKGSPPSGRTRLFADLLKPIDARLMRCYPVSTRINHVGNDDPECSTRVELAQIQNRLFS